MAIRRLSLGVMLALAVLALMIGVSSNARAAAVCTPTSTVSGAYAQNGAGDVCFQTATLCSYINSWNMNTVEVNGTDYTNRWVSSNTISALNGKYVIHYVGAYAWSHFEIGGSCSNVPTSVPPTGVPPTGVPPTGVPPTRVPPTGVPPTTVPQNSVSINSGGAATGSFLADQYFSGGSTYTNTRTIDVSQIPAGTAPAAIFSTERYGAMTYTIPNRSGAQTVTLYFVETYVTAAGQRVFNVSINGTSVLSNFDIFAAAGGANRAIARSFNTTANSSGQVVIQFTAVTQNPKISGLTVTAGGPQPTTIPPTGVPPTGVPPTGVPPTSVPPNSAVFRVDANGNITKDNVIFRVRGGSWFGLQGRHEPSNDSVNPSGAPLEQYMGNVFWMPSSRTYDQDIAEFVAMKINVVRLPLSPQTLNANEPQGMAPYLKNSDSVKIANSRLALETIAKKLDAAGISILWDIHSCSNYVDWRKGRLDARPPYVDATRDNYDFPREDSSCAATNNPPSVTRIQAYNETLWLQDLKTLASFSSTLGLKNVIGIDIFNEPWDYTWAEWSTLAGHAYNTINAANPNILVFVQGISATAGNQDGSPDTVVDSPYGADPIPNWGGNLYSAGANPPAIPKDRLVYSPHVYGVSVYVGQQFVDQTQAGCAGLEGDPVGDAKCRLVMPPVSLLRQGWDAQWGYLKAQGYAVVIGEWGGNFSWPGGKASLRDQNRYSYVTDHTIDQQWQNALVDYLIAKNIRDTIYWSINPESGDTGGLYTTPYQPGTNESAWGTWGPLDSAKMSMLQRLWGN